MTNANDLNKLFQDMFKDMPVDGAAFKDVFKNSADLNERLSNVALSAAGKSSELAAKWTEDTIGKLTEMSKAKEEPADYAKAAADFAASQAEVAANNMAAFAEIARQIQMDTVEVVMAASRSVAEDASASVKKTTKGKK